MKKNFFKLMFVATLLLVSVESTNAIESSPANRFNSSQNEELPIEDLDNSPIICPICVHNCWWAYGNNETGDIDKIKCKRCGYSQEYSPEEDQN